MRIFSRFQRTLHWVTHTHTHPSPEWQQCLIERKKKKKTFIRNHSQRQRTVNKDWKKTPTARSQTSHIRPGHVASSCLLLRLIRTVQPLHCFINSCSEIIAVTKQVSTMHEQTRRFGRQVSPVKNVCASIHVPVVLVSFKCLFFNFVGSNLVKLRVKVSSKCKWRHPRVCVFCISEAHSLACAAHRN